MFRALFLEQVKLKTYQWTIDQRIACAKQLLLTTKHSINQIFIMSGYDDPLYFSQIFKRNTAISAKQKRES
jgi:transcriptional regulator GlxA family with amidase domain